MELRHQHPNNIVRLDFGTELFERGPRGVRLTAAGRAFLVEARHTLDVAARAVTSARGAAMGRDSPLRFAHGELSVYGTDLENLLARFRDANPEAQIEISSSHDGEIFHALRERRVDVGSVFFDEWPVPGFAAHRLIEAPITGVLLPGSHPLAAQPSIQLAQLRALTWLNSVQDFDPVATTPSRFDLARLENAFAMLDVNTRVLAGIDQCVQRYGDRRW